MDGNFLQNQNQEKKSPTEKDHEELPPSGSSEETPGSGKGKLPFMLKVLKIGRGQAQRIDQSFVCEVCRKEFTSCKALKLHKRVHKEEVLIDMPENPQTHNAPIGIDQQSCFLCGKTFSSTESLSRHMRCHPEGEWRGIELLAAAMVYTDEQIDSGGSTNAMQDREALPATSYFSTTKKKKLREAVEELIMLARSDSSSSFLTHLHMNEQYKLPTDKSLINKAEIEDPGRVFELKKRKFDYSAVGCRKDFHVKKLQIVESRPIEIAETVNLAKDVDEGESVLEPEKSARKGVEPVNPELPREDDDRNSRKSKDLVKKITESSGTRKELISDGTYEIVKIIKRNKNSSARYKCNDCNKCFPTFQALGGHRSSHKPKTGQTSAIDEPSPATAEDVYQQPSPTNEPRERESSKSSSLKLGQSTYQCKVCKKNFSTGETLEGHQRSHSISPIQAVPSIVPVDHRFLGFDLNEEPPMEDADFDPECVAGEKVIHIPPRIH